MIIEVVDQGFEHAMDIEGECCYWWVGDWFIG